MMKNGDPIISEWKTKSFCFAYFFIISTFDCESLPPITKSPSNETNHLNFSNHKASSFIFIDDLLSSCLFTLFLILSRSDFNFNEAISIDSIFLSNFLA